MKPTLTIRSWMSQLYSSFKRTTALMMALVLGSALPLGLSAAVTNTNILNPGFENGATDWDAISGGGSFDYPTTGGNPDGYGIMNHNTGWGNIWIANGNTIIPLTDLSMSVGETYQFFMDMKIISGTNVGGFKVDFFTGTGANGSTGNMFATLIGDGSTWETYSFNVTIPAGVDGVKLVPLWGADSEVGFDNLAYDDAPYVAPSTTYTWSGGDGDWSTAGNWAENTVPDLSESASNSVATISSGTAQYNGTANGDFQLRNGNTLHIDTGATWEQTDGIAWIQVNGGNIVLDGGTFDAGTAGNINGFSGGVLTVTSNGGRLDMNGGMPDLSTADINGPFTFGATAGANLGTQTFDYDFTFTSTAGALLTSSATFNGDLTVNGVILQLSATTTLNGDLSHNAPGTEFQMNGANYTATEGCDIDVKLVSFAGGSTLTMQGGSVTLSDDSANKGTWDGQGVGKGFDFTTGSTAELRWTHSSVTVADVEAKCNDGTVLANGAINLSAFTIVEDSEGILLTLTPLAASYDITASASIGGSISPTGTVTVDAETDQTFTMTADANYNLVDVVVDGVSEGVVSSYTFTNVTAAHTIVANFSYQGLAESDFENAGAEWSSSNDSGTFVYDYPASGGNTDGYARIDHSADDGGTGYLTANSGNIIATSDLSITAGNIYNFELDMIIESGDNFGGLLVEFYESTDNIGKTSELYVDEFEDGSSWGSYQFPVYVPHGTDGIKIKLVSGEASVIGYDNVGVDTTVVASFATNVIPDAAFEYGYAAWQDGGKPDTVFTAYSSGGVGDSGYLELDNSAGYGVLVANNGDTLTLANLGLTAGESYEFTMDMYIEQGDNVGGMKFEYYTGATWVGDSGNLYPSEAINDGLDWETYTFTATIPASADSIKLVPLWGPDSIVGFDNIAYSTTPVVPDPILNPGFEDGSANWDTAIQGGGVVSSFPTTGGSNSDGYGIMDATAQTGWGAIWVANNNSVISVDALGLTPGNTYELHLDMKLEAGTNLGGIKADYFVDGAGSGSTGDMKAAYVIGDGTTWETYSFKVELPADKNGLKLVPLWGQNSSVAFDNIGIREPTDKTVTASANAGGSISPAGASTVAFDGSVAYTIAADSGYQIVDVTVNGSSVGAVTSYTFTNVTNTSTIDVTFEALASSYDITASAGTGGSISPSGVTAVDLNANQSYTITPDAGYTVLDVLVDGASVGAVSTYEFTSVSSVHTISATFTDKTFLKLDFQGNAGDNPYDSSAGWIKLTHEPEPGSPWIEGDENHPDVGGSGYDFSMESIGAWAYGWFHKPEFNQAGETPGAEFTLGGLTPGQEVELYAAQGWGGDGLGAYIVYGDSGPGGVKANGGAAVSNVGTSDIARIGMATADSNGEVSGIMYSSDAGLTTVGEGQSSGFIFAISPAPASTNNFSDWIAGYSVGSDTGLSDDADGDGKSNGIENVLGTDPSAADAAGLSSGSLSGSNFTLTHPRNATPGEDLTIAYEWSTDLTTFNASGAESGGITVDIVSDDATPTSTVTATITGTVPEKLFIRLSVTQ